MAGIGATPSTWNRGSTGPRWSEIADFEQIIVRSASAVTPREKSSLTLIGSPLRSNESQISVPQRGAEKRKTAVITLNSHFSWRKSAKSFFVWKLSEALQRGLSAIAELLVVSTYRPVTHIKVLITATVAGCCKENFSHIRFFADGPNARWLSLVDDFVTTNFGTEPDRHVPVPRSKILATPLVTALQ